MEHSRRYIFDGMHNVRDLGGHAAEGGVTRFGVLLRSDLPWMLTAADRERVRALGLVASLDLRDTDESIPMRDELQDLPWMEYRQIPMLGVEKAAAKNRPGGVSAFDGTFFWGEEYIRMLEENRPWARDCVEYLAEARGAVLFHCFTGKDRTGILSALVLGICGVSTADVAADYSVSQLYLQPVYAWMRQNLEDFYQADVSMPFFSTAAENILTLVGHLEREYGGAAGFLRQCGAGEDTLEALRRRLIKKA